MKVNTANTYNLFFHPFKHGEVSKKGFGRLAASIAIFIGTLGIYHLIIGCKYKYRAKHPGQGPDLTGVFRQSLQRNPSSGTLEEPKSVSQEDQSEDASSTSDNSSNSYGPQPLVPPQAIPKVDQAAVDALRMQKEEEQYQEQQSLLLQRQAFDQEVKRVALLPEEEFYQHLLIIEDSKLMLACISARTNLDCSKLSKEIITSKEFLQSRQVYSLIRYIEDNRLQDTFGLLFFEAWGGQPIELLKISQAAFKIMVPLFDDAKFKEMVELLDAETIGPFNECFFSDKGLETIRRLGLTEDIIKLSKESKMLEMKLSDLPKTWSNFFTIRSSFRLYFLECNDPYDLPKGANDLLMRDLPLLSVEQVKSFGVHKLGRAVGLLKPQVFTNLPLDAFTHEQKVTLLENELEHLSVAHLTAWKDEIDPVSFWSLKWEVLVQLDWSQFSDERLNRVVMNDNFIQNLPPEELLKIWDRIERMCFLNVRNKFTDEQLKHIIEQSELHQVLKFALSLGEYSKRKISQLGLSTRIIESIKQADFFHNELPAVGYAQLAVYIADCKDPYEGPLDNLKPKDIALLTVEQAKEVGLNRLSKNVIFLKKEALQAFEPSEFTEEQARTILSQRLFHISDAQLFAWSDLLRREHVREWEECDPDIVKRIDWNRVIPDMKDTAMYAKFLSRVQQ